MDCPASLGERFLKTVPTGKVENPRSTTCAKEEEGEAGAERH